MSSDNMSDVPAPAAPAATAPAAPTPSPAVPATPATAASTSTSSSGAADDQTAGNREDKHSGAGADGAPTPVPARSFPPLPHPPSYYQPPSATSHSTRPDYTAVQLAELEKLPPDNPIYVPVLKRYLINPFKLKEAAEARQEAAAGAVAAVKIEPAPLPPVSDADAPPSKSLKTEHGSSAPSSTPSASPTSTGDEFDREEAAGALDHLKTSEEADKQAAEAVAGEQGEVTVKKEGEGDGAADGDKSKDRKRKRENRGQNKTSERVFFDPKKDSKEISLCKELALGKKCIWGDKCKFSHDVQAFFAARPRDLKGECPLFSRYGTCPMGLNCRWSPDVHTDTHKPAEPLPLPVESNVATAQLLRELKSCGLGGAKYKRLFPKTSELTPKYEAWKKVKDRMQNERQKEKEKQDRIKAKEAREAREAQAKMEVEAASEGASATAPAEAPAAETSTPAAAAAADPAPSVAPSADSSSAPSSSSSSSAAPIPASISTAAAPVVFTAPPLTSLDIEIAALKANYSPPHPMKLDPFQIITEDHYDWSSGCLLIDLERRPFDPRGKLYLAPLTTVGNVPFRRVCRQFGADVTIGEMAMSNSLNKGSPTEWSLLRRHPDEKYFGIQIAGSFPDQVSRACELIQQTCSVDFVDLNVGCPLDQVVNKGLCSGMMQRKRMKNLEPLLRTMYSMLDCPATVKIRMGWTANEITAPDLLPIIHRTGMAAVTIHGRTRAQRYTKTADWQFIEDAAAYAHERLDDLPVIANGDVYTFEDYEQIVRPDSKVATTMIARGALVKPWLFTEVKERRHWDISAGERLDMLRDFVRCGHEHYGTDTKGLEQTRRFLLEWLSFLHRYVPVGLLERPRVGIQQKNPPFYARSDLEQLLASSEAKDWIRITEMLIGPVPDGFRFTPKHKSAGSAEDAING